MNNSVYERVANGEGVMWPGLNEEEKYGIWSLHLQRGNHYVDFFEFCNVMDVMSARFGPGNA